jgi:hypothetical protein
VPRSRSLPLVCAVILTTACQNPSAPLVVPSSYVARSVEGTPLPATFIHGGMTDVALLADTIHLYPLGVAERISIYRRTAIGYPVTIDTTRSQESYTVRGDSLLFHRDCPPNANCVAPPAGIFSADRRKLLLELWPGPLALYDRVSPKSRADAFGPSPRLQN